MAAPTSLANASAQSLDTLYAADGTPGLKLGIGSVAPTGLTPAAEWQGSATHVDGATFNAGSDGISVVGVVNSSGIAVGLALDASGNVPVADAAVLAALAGLTPIPPIAPTIFVPFSLTDISSEVTIWTPASGKKFRLMGYVLSQGTLAGDVTVRDNTAGSTILVIPAQTVGVAQSSPPMGAGILSTATDNVLTAQGTATETISGFVFGTEV